MKLALLLLTAVAAIYGRVTATRLAPEASVWFEPNHGQVKGRTEFVGRTGGAFLCLTGSAVVNSLLSAQIEHKATMRHVTMPFTGAQAETLPSPLFAYSARMVSRSLGRGGVNGGLNPLYPIGGPRSVRLAPRLVFEGVMQG